MIFHGYIGLPEGMCSNSADWAFVTTHTFEQSFLLGCKHVLLAGHFEQKHKISVKNQSKTAI